LDWFFCAVYYPSQTDLSDLNLYEYCCLISNVSIKSYLNVVNADFVEVVFFIQIVDSISQLLIFLVKIVHLLFLSDVFDRLSFKVEVEVSPDFGMGEWLQRSYLSLGLIINGLYFFLTDLGADIMFRVNSFIQLRLKSVHTVDLNENCCVKCYKCGAI
jgi:hypothetical protein